MDTKEKDSQVDIIGSHAAMLSITEIGLGSLLHSFHMPFTGYFLSLNQVFLLSRASGLIGANGSRFMPGSVSFVAAALKSLSPAGKKLTPMLAISMQGCLFNIGIFLFGHTTAGRIVGAAISSLWGFLQQFLIYFFIFGHIFTQAMMQFHEYPKIWFNIEPECIVYVLAGIVGLKVILSVTAAYLAPKVSSQLMTKYTSRISSASIKRKPQTPVPAGQGRIKKIAWLAAKDMCVWPFIACLLLGGVSFWFVEGGISTWVVINTLRPIAIGFLIFFAMRILPMEKLAGWLEHQHQGLGQAFRIALFKVRQM